MVTPAPFNKHDKTSMLGLNFGSGEFSLFFGEGGEGSSGKIRQIALHIRKRTEGGLWFFHLQ